MAEEVTQAGPIRMSAINGMVSSIRYKAQILARTTKLESGIMGKGVVGFAIGLLIAGVVVLGLL